MRTLVDNFEITLTKYEYLPNQWVTIPQGKLLGDICNVKWYIKCKHRSTYENSNEFGVAYSIREGIGMTQTDIVHKAWLIRCDEILKWASEVMNNLQYTD